MLVELLNQFGNFRTIDDAKRKLRTDSEILAQIRKTVKNDKITLANIDSGYSDITNVNGLKVNSVEVFNTARLIDGEIFAESLSFACRSILITQHCLANDIYTC